MAAVIVHGGAASVSDAIADSAVAGCREAAEKAYKALESGKSSLDAGMLLRYAIKACSACWGGGKIMATAFNS